MISLLVFILTVIVAALLYYLRESNSKDNKIRDSNINLLLKISIMEDADPRKAKLLEKAKFILDNKDIDKKLNNILNNKIDNEYEVLEIALNYFINEDYVKAVKAFKHIESNSEDEYVTAIGKSFLGSIYLSNIIDENENPEEYLLDAINRLEKLNLSNEGYFVAKAISHTDLGIYYKQNSQIKKSENQYRLALNIFNKLNALFSEEYDINIGEQYQNIYSLHAGLGKLDVVSLNNAYKYKKKAFKVNSGHITSYVNTISSLGFLYIKKRDFKKAKYFFILGEKVLEEVENKEDFGDNLLLKEIAFNVNFSEYYRLKAGGTHVNDDLKLSKFYLLKNEENFKNLKNFSGAEILRSYGLNMYALGLINQDLEKYDTALKYYLKSKKVRFDLTKNNNGNVGVFSVELGHVYYRLAEIYSSVRGFINREEARNYAGKALNIYNDNIQFDLSLKNYIGYMKEIANS